MLGSSAGLAAASAPAPVVDGNLIRDSRTGEEFVPHGVNWPSFEYACRQGWGYSNLGADPATAQAMREWNIDTVRIPLNQDCWLGNDGLPMLPFSSEGYRLAVEDFVIDLTEAGIVVILDLHWSAPPAFAANGLRPMPDSSSKTFWVSVAERFKANPAVMFDLFNEPHSRWNPGSAAWDFALTWRGWAQGGQAATNHPDTEYPFTNPRFRTIGMSELVAAVRSTGASQPIILSGLDYAHDLSRWDEFAPDDSQIIAGFHNYPGKRCNGEACWQSEVAELSTKVPVITTEVGQNDCRSSFLQRYMTWADDYHIGYLAWAWWDLSLPGNVPSCTNFALIEDLAGTPTPDYGSAFREHLISLPTDLPEAKPVPRRKAGLKIGLVQYRQGRLKAVIRLDPDATAPVTASIRLRRASSPGSSVRGQRFRVIRLRLQQKDGAMRLGRTIQRTWTPTMFAVRYRGDERLLPDSLKRRIPGRQ
jgi:hypothetical protein